MKSSDIKPNLRLGKVLIIGLSTEVNAHNQTLWKAICDCGNTFYALRADFAKGKGRKHCGKCDLFNKHKDAYISWQSAKQRCRDKNHANFANYGAKGITFSEEWNTFEQFLKDMGDPPVIFNTRTTLERKDNNKGYYKDNCEWATSSEQRINQS